MASLKNSLRFIPLFILHISRKNQTFPAPSKGKVVEWEEI